MDESDISDIYSISENEDNHQITEDYDVLMLHDEDWYRLYVKKVHPSALLPERKTNGAAGYDLSICEEQEIPPHTQAILRTGICVQIPKGMYGRIAPRSSAAAKGILINGGVIDCDYRGEVKVIVFNISNEVIHININDRIAQMIIEKIAILDIYEVFELDKRDRGNRGLTPHPCRACYLNLHLNKR
ncbi:uncharacterized protein LOC141845960 [Curcuma longa]|uniref:uncharacterized protein LOC141845960 n=1 Tax=Curcuma longa TaxID=136217 RepID=UPI003D9DB9E5